MVSFLRKEEKKRLGGGEGEGGLVARSIELHNSKCPEEVYLELIYFPSWDPVDLI